MMKLREYITKLQKLDQEAVVLSSDDDHRRAYGYCEAEIPQEIYCTVHAYGAGHLYIPCSQEEFGKPGLTTLAIII